MKYGLLLSRGVPFAAAILILWFFFNFQGHQWRFENESFHSTTESVEAVSVFLLALFILGRRDAGRDDKLVPLAVGFLGMSILSVFHAVAVTGAELEFLQTVASLTGGVGFVCVWLRGAGGYEYGRKWLPWAAAAVSVAFGGWTFLYPGAVPATVRDGEFTGFAVTLNLFAGALFMAGAWRFLLDSRRDDGLEDYLFFIIGLLFGLTGLTFKYSPLWSAEWWFWHGLRLLASLLVLVILVLRQMHTAASLEASMVEFRRAEDLREAGEEHRRQLGRQIQLLLDSAGDGIFGVDIDGQTVFINRAAAAMLGYEAEELIGKPSHAVFHHTKADGTPYPSEECPIYAAYRDGIDHSGEELFWRREGTGLPIEFTSRPILEEGRLTGAVVTFRDITERKLSRARLMGAMEDLARSNRDLEQFAYAISHDLQAPLRSVAGFSKILADDYRGRLDREADKWIDLIVGGAKRMQQMIEDILAFSRVGRGGVPEPVSFETILGQAMENLKAAIEEKGAVIAHEPLPTVKADQSQMVSLLQNLLDNSIKFSVGLPRIHVAALREGNDWVFSVRDNGIGIAREYLDRIFALFQRLHTAEEYQGTGVGLALCKRIVERHGGRIWAESKEGEGSTFFFTIPGEADGQTDGLNGRELR